LHTAKAEFITNTGEEPQRFSSKISLLREIILNVVKEYISKNSGKDLNLPYSYDGTGCIKI
jgi:hypothetical protein